MIPTIQLKQKKKEKRVIIKGIKIKNIKKPPACEINK